MSDAVARDYVGRADADRRNKLVKRDYLTSRRQIRPEAKRDPNQTLATIKRVLGTAIPTGAAVVFGAYVTSRAADGSLTINGDPFKYSFVETLGMTVPFVALVLLVMAAVTIGPRYIGGQR
jgi:hypothetical protein